MKNSSWLLLLLNTLLLLDVGGPGGSSPARSADVHVRCAIICIVLVLFFWAARLAAIIGFLIKYGNNTSDCVIRSIVDAAGPVRMSRLARA